MRVLVTGGSGVVGTSTITALLQRGHSVVLLSRHAQKDARQWPHGVTAHPGDVADPRTLQGAADGCDAVLHLVAVVEEEGPNATFERVNVEGTRNVVREAERAGVTRFVYVSSLGAAEGKSPYHQSKRKGEAIVRDFHGDWLVVRPGNVYGPGDEQISLLLRMIRTLPVVPLIGNGAQRFQPLWHEDAAEALALAVERGELVHKALDLAGPEVVTQRGLAEQLITLTGRDVKLADVPEVVTSLGIKALGFLGVDVPFSDSQMQMLDEGNVIPNGSENALTTVFGLAGTRLHQGLARLSEAQPEQVPGEGVGSLRRKRYWGEVRGSALAPGGIIQHLRENFPFLTPDYMDTAAEPGAPRRVDLGETLTLSLPLRGNMQVRVVEVEACKVTMLTLSGHPLAGAVRFLAEDRGTCVRFEVQVYDRAASIVDWVAMRTVGERLQDAAWVELVEKTLAAAGGVQVAPVTHEAESLDELQAEKIEEWIDGLVLERKRDEAGV
ncbi:MAG: NAD-dependent epimerase/dehydratase [Gemmatimonadetes bacterium]|nr:NAD-dependent epimerase/dehydratase [Gemmatimonadota bacterium]